jgi:outer membrane protein TolC
LGAQLSPRFIANNAVREYASQAVANETLGMGHWAAVQRADSETARSAVELAIARRGLVSTVTSLFFESIAADNKVVVADRAHAESADFTSLTTRREHAREAAHADVVKAQLAE